MVAIVSDSLNRVSEVVSAVKHMQEVAETKGKGKSKYITDRCNTIATNEHKRLNIITDRKTGELISEPKCSYRYYTNLMNDLRQAIKSLGFKHHAIEKNISSFVNKYSDKNQQLSYLLDPNQSIEKLRENIIKLRAQSVTSSAFRREIMQLRIEHHLYYLLEPRGAIKDWKRDDDEKQLNKKLNSQIKFNPEWVESLCRDLLTKKDPSVSDLCIGLSLATGRRLTEVMKTAEFEPMEKESLFFTGQLKTKNRNLFETEQSYEIPTLIESDIVCKSLEKLRKMTKAEPVKYRDVQGNIVTSTVADGDLKDYYHNRGVEHKYQSTMNRAVKALFKNGYFQLKDCRALYTEITYEKHHEKGEARSAYRHRVLGHSRIETQLHYEAFSADTDIKSIELISNDDEKGSGADGSVAEAFLKYLSSADAIVKSYARAPKIALIHEWLKETIAAGVDYQKVTPSFVRRFCLVDGKQINFKTAERYLNDFIKIGEFKAPDPEPKNETEKRRLELKAAITELQNRLSDIDDETNDLEIELEGIKARMEEIELENDDLESERDDKESELEELQDELKSLDQDEDSEAEEPEWPEPEDLDVHAQKDGNMWLVWAVVNGQRFEQRVKGRKAEAIKQLRLEYKNR